MRETTFSPSIRSDHHGCVSQRWCGEKRIRWMQHLLISPSQDSDQSFSSSSSNQRTDQKKNGEKEMDGWGESSSSSSSSPSLPSFQKRKTKRNLSEGWGEEFFPLSLYQYQTLWRVKIKEREKRGKWEKENYREKRRKSPERVEERWGKEYPEWEEPKNEWILIFLGFDSFLPPAEEEEQRGGEDPLGFNGEKGRSGGEERNSPFNRSNRTTHNDVISRMALMYVRLCNSHNERDMEWIMIIMTMIIMRMEQLILPIVSPPFFTFAPHIYISSLHLEILLRREEVVEQQMWCEANIRNIISSSKDDNVSLSCPYF